MQCIEAYKNQLTANTCVTAFGRHWNISSSVHNNVTLVIAALNSARFA